MVLLVTRLKWKLNSVCLGIVLILNQDRCTVCAERTIGRKNHFGCTQWNSLATWVMWNLISVHLDIWMHPMVLLGDEAQVNAHFIPFGDSANLDAR
jgi:hypothetical protein